MNPPSLDRFRSTAGRLTTNPSSLPPIMIPMTADAAMLVMSACGMYPAFRERLDSIT